MTKISNITLTQQPSFHCLTIRKTINFMMEFLDFVSYSFDKIPKHLDSLNELPGDAPIICFHNVDLENLDVEIGFPVATPLSGKDDITAKTIPSLKVVSAIDLGPYEKQEATLEALFTWIQSNGYEMQGEIYYQYLNDTERPENELLTKIIIPIK
ncbi:MAG: GyrI-like domain-containing protein [Methanomicrobiales archaeon]|jgi:effector-binding domain-containing protein|nr:GyrI-like domain-containing protein [Methanomicrobiales archaeon]